MLWRGRKVAGAAQRRTKAGLLIQGSVQPPALGLRRADWQQAMLAAAGAGWRELTPAEIECLLGRAAVLAAEKYSQDAFNRKR